MSPAPPIGRSRRFDVCVVGAGPAGLSAALALAKGGAKVVLLDRHARPGKKACGGGITSAGFELAGLLGGEGAPFRFSRFSVRSALGEASLDTGAAFVEIVDRPRWQAGLIERAAAAGCEVRLGERVIGIDGSSVRTARERISCDHIVAADGASSVIRRSLRLSPGPRIIARQIVVPIQDAPPALESTAPTVFFDPTLFASGYAWSFPAPDGLRLGCGASAAKRSGRELAKAFHRWLASLGLRVDSSRERAGTIPCGYVGHRFGRVRLAGDAAGLASPVTGEGIRQALVSGDEVAREVLDPRYRSSAIPALGRAHRRTAALLDDGPGSVLFYGAALFLERSWVRREAVARYCRSISR